MANPYVSVVGNVCSGKTTFVNRFAALHGTWQGLQESLGEGFWKSSNQTDLTFDLAAHFMTYYANQHLHARNTPGPLIQENCLEASSLYPEAYYELGRFSIGQFNTLKLGYSVFLETLPKPDFYVYLYAPLEVLMARAEERDEPLRTTSRKLIPLMQNRLETWIQSRICRGSVFKLDTNRVSILEGSSMFEATLDYLKAHKVFPM